MSNVRRLPGPIVDLWDWQRLGACRGRDSAQFFHPDGERGSSRPDAGRPERRRSAACPVRAECAAHALAVREPYGVWGGFSESERLRLLAVGWEDLADRRRSRVDVARLEARLGQPHRSTGARPAPGRLRRVHDAERRRGPPRERGVAVFAARRSTGAPGTTANRSEHDRRPAGRPRRRRAQLRR